MDIHIPENKDEIEQVAGQVLQLARDTITVRVRFFDTAISKIKTEFRYDISGVASKGEVIYINPAFLLRTYVEEPAIAVRIYMHVTLHLIFMHQMQYDKLKEQCWDAAADMAVENIIFEMDIAGSSMRRDMEAKEVLTKMKRRVPVLTADKIYRELAVYGMSREAEKNYKRLFTVDGHEPWHNKSVETDEIMINQEDWQKIARRIQTELKAFTQDKGGSDSLMAGVDEVVRERYNYRDILQRFVETGEEIKINDNEFDYVYYTYGLRRYGNLPLIEPLEYMEDKKVREIVIALDTSASCKGKTVKNFVKKTYEMLKSEENFFRKINIHIIQCDVEIRSDIKIQNEDDLKEFIEHGELRGFGGTDFRPVFDYVEILQEQGEFENLKGLIYFTDGFGIYPEKMPDYDVIFAFLNEDENRAAVPSWAMKVVMESSEVDVEED